MLFIVLIILSGYSSGRVYNLDYKAYFVGFPMASGTYELAGERWMRFFDPLGWLLQWPVNFLSFLTIYFMIKELCQSIFKKKANESLLDI